MDNTVDDKQEVEQDAGAVPAISTNTEELKGWMNEIERTHSNDWYFTQRDWDRTVGYGKVPPERERKNNGDETGSTGNGNL